MRKVDGEQAFCVLIYMNSYIFQICFILFISLSCLIFDFVCLTLSSADTHRIAKYARTCTRDTHTHTHTKSRKIRTKNKEKVGKPKKKEGGSGKKERRKKERTKRKGGKEGEKMREKGGEEKKEREKKEIGRGMFQTQLLHYCSKSDNKSNHHHHLGAKSHL